MAEQYFHHNIRWQIVICKECQYGIWPDQIRSHLQNKQHQIRRKEAEAIQEDVQKWQSVAHYRTNFDTPAAVDQPIPELPVYKDGLLCTLDPGRCRFICRSATTMRPHWFKQHGWSARNVRGGSGTTKSSQVQQRQEQAFQQVHCQRLFVQGPHSNYFEVRQAEQSAEEEREEGTVKGIWQRAWARADKKYNDDQAEQTITEGEKDEVNPWLRRAGWVSYLAGCEREDLLQAVRQPNPDAEEESEQEPVEAAIWKAMEDVAVASQVSVVNSGIMVRMHAIRTEKEQVRYEPLQPYWDQKDVVRRCHAWQQMLMFFARTQQAHKWRSPRYRFNRRQQQAWRQLVQEAERQEQQGEENEEEDSPEPDPNRDGMPEPDPDKNRCPEPDPDENGRPEPDPDENGRPEPDPDTEKGRPWTAIQQACLDFCIELMNQKVHRKEYDCAMVCAMAVLGVNPFREGWRDPESYPPIMSAVMKIAHFMIVQKAAQLAGEEDDQENEFSPCESACMFDSNQDSGYASSCSPELSSSPGRRSSPVRHSDAVMASSPPQGGDIHSASSRPHEFSSPVRWNTARSTVRLPSKTRSRSSLEWVQVMMDSFMVRRTNSPIDWLLDLRAYGMKIHYNTTSTGYVMWKDKYELQYKDVSFTMSEFRGMVHQLVSTTQQALFDVMHVQSREELPEIPWNSLHDDPSNARIGWSFIDDTRNRMPVDGQQWFFQRVQEKHQLCSKFVKAGTTSGISKERITDYMRQVTRFRERLLVLMHMAGGQPARGPEILSVRHRNTAQGGHRNLFIEDGLVVFVTRYSKQYMITGDVKIIHRYLPQEVGELVVWYLWLVLPFVERMQSILWPKEKVSSHMWPADIDGQKWTTDRMSQIMKQVTDEGMGQAVGVAAYREMAIAISREWVRGSTQFQRDEGEPNEEWERENAMANAADEQATHTSQIAGSIYARNSMERSGVNADRRQRFRMVSTDWHRFLQFESQREKDAGRDLKRKRCPFEEDANEEQTARRLRMKQMDATAALKRMMQKEVSFRSVQGAAMRAIQDGISPIVAVMPTGAGKSVLFMLPAWAEAGGVSIVVVPLNGLRADMVHRCSQLGIKCAIWNDRRQPDGASIVLITPEKAIEEQFQTYIRRIRATGQLDRIVIDECHTILNAQMDFRNRLQRLGEMASAETQMVLLTATFPPSMEDVLFERMYWRREEVHMVRASTVRQNIQYSVVDGGQTQQQRDSMLERIVEEFLEKMAQEQSKALIMCNSRGETERIAASGMFPCEYYHAGLSNATRQELLEGFRQGQFRVIAATGAFGMGIDINNIHLVVHVDNPRDMLDYGQSSGRGGRDGLPTQAVIIRGGMASTDALVAQYMNKEAGQCRRVILDGYLDGDQGRQRCQESEEACDICQEKAAVAEEETGQAEEQDRERQQEAVQTQQRRHRERQHRERQHREKQHRERQHRVRVSGHEQQEAEQTQQQLQDTEQRREQERQQETAAFQAQDQQRAIPQARRVQQSQSHAIGQTEMQRQLEQWKGVCAVCRARGEDHHHSISHCQHAQQNGAEDERRRWQGIGGIRYQWGVACYKCGLPPGMCERSSEAGVMQKGKTCQYWGIVIGVVVGIKHGYPQIWQRWKQQRQREGVEVDRPSFMQWLGERDSDSGCSRILAAFRRLTQEVETLAE